MIVIDTHIWLWWVDNSPRLTQHQRKLLEDHRDQGLGVSIISCWEVAKLVEKQKIGLGRSLEEWMEVALSYPGIQLLELTIPIAVESTRLVGFHRDPADQLIVATAKVHDVPLLTADAKILSYEGIKILGV